MADESYVPPEDEGPFTKSQTSQPEAPEVDARERAEPSAGREANPEAGNDMDLG